MAQHDEKPSEFQKALAKLSAFEEKQIDKAIQGLAGTVDGRKFLWWLLRIGKIGLQPATTNALSTQFNCGELNVGLQIQARIITVDSAVYVRMMQENQNVYRELEQHFGDTSASSDDYDPSGPGS